MILLFVTSLYLFNFTTSMLNWINNQRFVFFFRFLRVVILIFFFQRRVAGLFKGQQLLEFWKNWFFGLKMYFRYLKIKGKKYRGIFYFQSYSLPRRTPQRADGQTLRRVYRYIPSKKCNSESISNTSWWDENV